MTKQRCRWAEGDPLMRAYHDAEWGRPERDGRALWEKLMLDGFQAGLSWITILRKRDAFREAFAGFDPVKVARFTEADVARLLGNAGIVRSRAKIEATIGGARAFLAMQEAGEDFSAFCWGMVGGKPIRNATGVVPAQTELSVALSNALKQRGFKFVGPVIVYAWMQATGAGRRPRAGVLPAPQVKSASSNDETSNIGTGACASGGRFDVRGFLVRASPRQIHVAGLKDR